MEVTVGVDSDRNCKLWAHRVGARGEGGDGGGDGGLMGGGGGGECRERS